MRSDTELPRIEHERPLGEERGPAVESHRVVQLADREERGRASIEAVRNTSKLVTTAARVALASTSTA